MYKYAIKNVHTKDYVVEFYPRDEEDATSHDLVVWGSNPNDALTFPSANEARKLILSYLCENAVLMRYEV